MGEALSQLLQNAIDERIANDETDEETEDDVIGLITEGSGVTESTIRNILNGDIDCPPPERTDPLAADLPITDEEVEDALAEDGCQQFQSAKKALSYDQIAKEFERQLDDSG